MKDYKMNRSVTIKQIKSLVYLFLLGLLSCSDSGNSSSSEETGKASCIENAFDRNKTISAILDECSVSANDILETDIEGIDLGSCSRADVVSNSGKTILELIGECGGSSIESSSSSVSGNVCYYPETEQCFEGSYTVCPGTGGELLERCPVTGNISSSSGSASENVCYYPETEQCFEGSYTVCPGTGGELLERCPVTSNVSSSSPITEISSSANISSSSGANPESSSSVPEFEYCVFEADETCLQGVVTLCPPGGELSNSCPWVSSSSAVNESSSSVSSGSSSSEQEFEYCVFDGDKSCLQGPVTLCPPGGELSNSCPWVSSSSAVSESSSSSFAESSSSETIADSYFTDSRDNKKYKIKDIGGKTWFLEDLAYDSQSGYTWDKAKIACPDGWHLPDNSEWNSLHAVWDVHGVDFSAYSTGHWWSATDISKIYAYIWLVSSDSLDKYSSSDKANIKAVRCVKGPPPTNSSSSSLTKSSSSSVVSSSSSEIAGVEYFTDSRNGKQYKTKDFGNGIVWFLEDLAYNSQPDGYTWNDAITACPDGWRLPRNVDWDSLKDVWDANKKDFGIDGGGDWWSITDRVSSLGSSGYHYFVSDEETLDSEYTDKGKYKNVRCVNGYPLYSSSSAAKSSSSSVVNSSSSARSSSSSVVRSSSSARSSSSRVSSSSSVPRSSSSKPEAPAASLPFKEYFESTNLWSTQYSGTKRWTVGTSTSYSGKAAYVSDNGTDYGYNNNESNSNSTTLSRLIKLPASTEDFTFYFYYKGYGNSSQDYMEVFLVPSSVAVTDAKPSADYQVRRSDLVALDWTLASFSLCARNCYENTYSEGTYRLVFYLPKGVGSIGTGYAIDNVVITKVDYFTDSRDNKRYRVKDIGDGTVWFLDNLTYNSKKLYTWDEAMKACPSGWRLPTHSEWSALNRVWAANKKDFGGGEDPWWSSTESRSGSVYGWSALTGSLVSSSTYVKTYNDVAVRCVK